MRSEGLNQGVFKFDVSPPIIDIQKMNLWHYVQFVCDAQHTLIDVYYDQGVLVITTDYTTDL